MPNASKTIKHAVDRTADNAKELLEDAADAEDVAEELVDAGLTKEKNVRQKVSQKLKELGEKFSGS